MGRVGELDRHPLQDEVNEYLDALRESGAINMFGSVPYIMAAFDVTKSEAMCLFFDWTATFGERHGIQ